MFGDIFYFLLTLSILVTFHEYGHYWVARRCGVKVLRFSVGFGYPIWQWTSSGGTQFVIAAIPLGGYVKMLDEREQAVAPELQFMAFNRQPASARAAILAAGPLANFLLAILAYWVVFVLGVPGYKPIVGDIQPGSVAERAGLREGQLITAVDGDLVISRTQVDMRLLRRLGDSGSLHIALEEPGVSSAYTLRIPIESWLAGEDNPSPYQALGLEFWYPPIEPVIDEVVHASPAEAAGLLAEDKILGIDGQSVVDWGDVARLLEEKYETSVVMRIERGGSKLEFNVNVAAAVDDSGEKKGRIGVSARLPAMPENMQVLERANVITALPKAIERTGAMIVFTLDSLKKMVVGLISPSHLGGPVTIAKIASMSAESGLGSYLQILALLSISLGIFNLLPIPVLDGGHLLIIAVQAVIRRPLPEKLLMWVQQAGLVMLLTIMVFAIYNDITRL